MLFLLFMLRLYLKLHPLTNLPLSHCQILFQPNRKDYNY